MKTQGYNRTIIAAAILGVVISNYTLYVEMAVEAKPGYKALCDISEHASCSRVLTSKYAKGFGLIKDSSFEIPNCVYGLLFYCSMIFLATFDHLLVVRFQLLLAVMSLLSCVYLAYLLVFVLQDLCVVCVSTYIVNGILTVLIYKKNKLLSAKNK